MKAHMGRGSYERYKNIKLNKIQLNDLMSESHRTKNLSKGIKIVSKTKDPQTCCIPQGRKGLAHGLLGWLNVNQAAKNTISRQQSRERYKDSLFKKRSVNSLHSSRELRVGVNRAIKQAGSEKKNLIVEPYSSISSCKTGN